MATVDPLALMHVVLAMICSPFSPTAGSPRYVNWISSASGRACIGLGLSPQIAKCFGRCTGLLVTKKEGNYKFFLASDDGALHAASSGPAQA